MNILLVDDEAGIREGLASFLRIKGHRVVTAATLAAALELLASETFDVLLTDWRIGGDQGEALVLASACPSIVVSGTPEDVRDLGDAVLVMRKPVAPRELLAAIERHAAQRTAATAVEAGATDDTTFGNLPRDTADRFTLALALAGASAAAARVEDDGTHATLIAPLVAGDAAIARLELLGGDLQVRGEAGRGLHFALRVWRDGRPEAATVAVPLGAPWPQARAIAVDCGGADPARLDEFLDALKRSRRRAAGRVAFVNVPPAWRLWLEISGRADDMPKRTKAGPRLPEFLNVLWSRA